MKPTVKLDAFRTPKGDEMILYRHDREFYIEGNGQILMHSRQHASELALARLGCAHLGNRESPAVLVGGLGLGYTLRQTLDLLPAAARVVVGELLAPVIDWNRRYFGDLNGQPLTDPRVELRDGDIVKLLTATQRGFDTILLDIDNGPRALTTATNQRLYGYAGIAACRRALRDQGCLAVWSAEPSKEFEQLLVSCGFQVRRYPVPTYEGSKAPSRFVWVASENRNHLPPGGSEPRRQSGQAGRRPAGFRSRR